MGFSRQEYWSGLSFLPSGDLPDSGLLHCRQILYHLSHQGGPKINKHAKVVTAKRKACVQSSRNRREGRGPESRKEPDGIWQEVEAELKLRGEVFSDVSEEPVMCYVLSHPPTHPNHTLVLTLSLSSFILGWIFQVRANEDPFSLNEK